MTIVPNKLGPPRFKLTFLGDPGVGKTSIIQRKVHSQFNFKVEPTTGVGGEHLSVISDLGETDLFMWDTAGQEIYNALVPMSVHGADGIVLVASIVDQLSLDNIRNWRDKAFDHANVSPLVFIAINKIDLQNSPTTIQNILSQLSQDFENIFFVSAKNGNGIDDMFVTIANELNSNSVVHAQTPLTPAPSNTTGSCSC